jgi:hypothetical protein
MSRTLSLMSVVAAVATAAIFLRERGKSDYRQLSKTVATVEGASNE